MREMLSPTSALIGKGLGDSVGLITDWPFRANLGHGGRSTRSTIAPYAYVGGLISLVGPDATDTRSRSTPTAFCLAS